MKLVNPANKRKYHDHRRRHRPGRRLGGGVAGRAGLQRRVLLLPGQPAPGALASPPRAASTPPRTTRTTATASTASSTTPSRAATSAPARPTSTAWPRSASTSSTSASPRACRSPASTAACWPTARFGGAQVSRTFYCRGQTGQQLLLGAYQALMPAGRPRQASRCTRAPRCSTWSSSTAGPAASSPATWSPGKIESYAGDAVVLATGGYGNVFYLSTNAKGCNVTATWRRLQARGGLRQPLLTRRSIRPASRSPATTSRKLTLMSRVAAQRRPHLGAEAAGRHAAARPDPRERARLLPRAEVSRASATWRRATSPRGPPRKSATRAAASARAAAASTSTSPTPSGGSASSTHPRALRQPLRHVRAHHRRGPVPGADADLPGDPLHAWAGCGSTTT